jgi:ABC-type multidrug transport system fused ATPase/permease subunit
MNEPTMGGGLEEVRKSAKQLMQLTWYDITIRAMPPTGRCKPAHAIKEPKIIIDNVDGTVMPGQFLAIIGASGKAYPNS